MIFTTPLIEFITVILKECFHTKKRHLKLSELRPHVIFDLFLMIWTHQSLVLAVPLSPFSLSAQHVSSGQSPLSRAAQALQYTWPWPILWPRLSILFPWKLTDTLITSPPPKILAQFSSPGSLPWLGCICSGCVAGPLFEGYIWNPPEYTWNQRENWILYKWRFFLHINAYDTV